MFKNLPANTWDMSLIPDLRRSHMPRGSYTHAPQLLSLILSSPCSAATEATAVRSQHSTSGEEPPLAAARESPHTAQQRLNTAEKQINSIFFRKTRGCTTKYKSKNRIKKYTYIYDQCQHKCQGNSVGKEQSG